MEISDAPAGTYVLRVINFASATPSYTLTESHFHAVTRTTTGKLEKYRLTCEKNGKVLQSRELLIGRGDQKRIDLSVCRRRA